MPFNVGGNIWNGAMASVHDYRSIITRGLVMNLDANAPGSYPGSGTTWGDLSGNGNNATLSEAGIGTVSGSLNTMAFDGADDYCYMAHDSTIEPLTGLTYELWCFSDYAVAGEKTLMMKNDGNISPYRGKRFWMYVWAGSGGELRSDIYNGTSYVKLSNGGAINLQPNTWHHVVWTVLDGDFIKFYVDSVLQSTHSISGIDILKTDDEKLAIGARYHAYPSVGDRRDHYTGHIPIVRMYNRALSTPEIKHNFNVQRHRFGV